jgi:hypothetical protein
VNAGSSSPKGSTIQTSNVSNKTTSAKKLGIFNGDSAKPGEFPYAVYLLINNNENQNSECTGVLYKSNFVLTAGNKKGGEWVSW